MIKCFAMSTVENFTTKMIIMSMTVRSRKLIIPMSKFEEFKDSNKIGSFRTILQCTLVTQNKSVGKCQSFSPFSHKKEATLKDPMSNWPSLLMYCVHSFFGSLIRSGIMSTSFSNSDDRDIFMFVCWNINWVTLCPRSFTKWFPIDLNVSSWLPAYNGCNIKMLAHSLTWINKDKFMSKVTFTQNILRMKIKSSRKMSPNIFRFQIIYHFIKGANCTEFISNIGINK